MRWLVNLLVTLLVCLFPMLAHAASVDDILSKIDANMTFDTRESTVQMTVTKSGRAKSYTMHSYGKGEDVAAVEYVEPARDKGTKMLKMSGDLWMYLPTVEKTQKISGHMLRQNMMGSDLSYEDMMQASAWKKQYNATIAGEETIDGRKCWKLEMLAKTSDVSYPKRLVWVDQALYIPVRQELYALSGMLLKTWTMTDIKAFGSRQFPMTMRVEDKVQANSLTEMTFLDLKFSVALEDEVFSQRWLERK